MSPRAFNVPRTLHSAFQATWPAACVSGVRVGLLTAGLTYVAFMGLDVVATWRACDLRAEPRYAVVVFWRLQRARLAVRFSFPYRHRDSSSDGWWVWQCRCWNGRSNISSLLPSLGLTAAVTFGYAHEPYHYIKRGLRTFNFGLNDIAAHTGFVR